MELCLMKFMGCLSTCGLPFAVLIVASDIFMKIASSLTELPTNPSFLSIFSRPLRWCREDLCDSRARDLYIYLVVSGFFWICFKRFLLANATAFGLNLLSYFSLKIDQYLSRNIPQDTTASTSNSMTTDFFPSKVASRLPRKLHTLTPKNGVPCNSCAGKPQKPGVIYMECHKHSCAGKFRFSGWSMEVGSEKRVPKQM